MRILVVEDELKLLRTLSRGLLEQGLSVDTAANCRQAKDAMGATPYDLIILDIMLPDGDGVELCRTIRQQGNASPILMLTAASSTSDKVRGLDAGADDYLPKPFEYDELMARVRTLLRRGRAAESVVLRVGSVEMNLHRRIVTRHGQPIPLTNREFAILELFMRNPDRILQRSEIGRRIWNMRFGPESNVIDVFVHNLRRKLSLGSASEIIHTIVGVGYVLKEGSN